MFSCAWRNGGWDQEANGRPLPCAGLELCICYSVQSLHDSSLKDRLQKKMLCQDFRPWSPLHRESSRCDSPWALGWDDESGRSMDCRNCSQSTRRGNVSVRLYKAKSAVLPACCMSHPGIERGVLWGLTSPRASLWNDLRSSSKWAFVKILGKDSAL